MKSCKDCAFRTVELTGYSEWTIMGQIDDCMGKLNPSFPLDSEDYAPEEKVTAAMSFADTCPAYRVGQPLGVGALGVDDPKAEFADWAKQFMPQSEGPSE